MPARGSSKLSDDHADTAAVVSRAGQWALAQHWHIDLAGCAYPTAVAIDSSDLSIRLNTIQSGSWDFAFSTSQFTAPIFRVFEKTQTVRDSAN